MLEAKVLHRFKCKYTKKVFHPGDIYRYPSEERMQYLASLSVPRVQWPPEDETPDLETLGYRDLQRLAKERGIKANLPSAELIAALREG